MRSWLKYQMCMYVCVCVWIDATEVRRLTGSTICDIFVTAINVGTWKMYFVDDLVHSTVQYGFHIVWLLYSGSYMSRRPRSCHKITFNPLLIIPYHYIHTITSISLPFHYLTLSHHTITYHTIISSHANHYHTAPLPQPWDHAIPFQKMVRVRSNLYLTQIKATM